MNLRERFFAPARDPVWAAGLGVVASLAAAFLVILLAGKDPVAAFGHLLEGALGGRGPIGESGIKAGVLINASRVALTGQAASPGIFDVMTLLGREKTVSRLRI